MSTSKARLGRFRRGGEIQGFRDPRFFATEFSWFIDQVTEPIAFSKVWCGTLKIVDFQGFRWTLVRQPYCHRPKSLKIRHLESRTNRFPIWTSFEKRFLESSSQLNPTSTRVSNMRIRYKTSLRSAIKVVPVVLTNHSVLFIYVFCPKKSFICVVDCDVGCLIDWLIDSVARKIQNLLESSKVWQLRFTSIVM